MAVERAELSVSLSLERMSPVSVAPGVQGQSSPESGQGRSRRRPPPPEEASTELVEGDSDPRPHRIDSLA